MQNKISNNWNFMKQYTWNSTTDLKFKAKKESELNVDMCFSKNDTQRKIVVQHTCVFSLIVFAKMHLSFYLS